MKTKLSILFSCMFCMFFFFLFFISGTSPDRSMSQIITHLENDGYDNVRNCIEIRTGLGSIESAYVLLTKTEPGKHFDYIVQAEKDGTEYLLFVLSDGDKPEVTYKVVL